jgi:hypothetical protein
MELLRWKARLSIIWVGMAVGTAAALLLSFMAPGMIENVMAGEWGGMPISGGTLAIFALFFIIPLVVAILCLTMDNSKWLNFILGIIWFIWFIYDMVNHATMEQAVPVGIWLMLIAGFVISAYIVYFAWKWPKEES